MIWIVLVRVLDHVDTLTFFHMLGPPILFDMFGAPIPFHRSAPHSDFVNPTLKTSYADLLSLPNRLASAESVVICYSVLQLSRG